MKSPNPTVKVSFDERIATLTLNRPERRNALSVDMWREFSAALDAVANSEARVLVITGEGSVFCAGADLSKPEGERTDLATTLSIGNDACLALFEIPVVTIAKVRGAAIGVGMNIALACDFVISTDSAKFGETFINLGLSIDGGGSWLLPRLVGLRAAKELSILGDVIDGATAHRMGIVSRSVSEDELEATVDAWCHRLIDKSADALRSTKRLLNDGSEKTFRQALGDEASAQLLNMRSDEARAGLARFRGEKPQKDSSR